MANFCANNLCVKGNLEDVVSMDNQFKGEHTYSVGNEAYTKTGYSFLNFLKPDIDNSPESLAEWASDNWGTRGDVDENMEVTPPESNNDGGKVMYNFDTLWNPPEKVYYEMSKQYPELTFEYYYEGYQEEDLQGEVIIKNGKLL